MDTILLSEINSFVKTGLDGAKAGQPGMDDENGIWAMKRVGGEKWPHRSIDR